MAGEPLPAAGCDARNVGHVLEELSMKRRDVLKSLPGIGAAALIASPAVAQSAPKLNWRLVSAFPKSLDTLYGGAVYFAKIVAEATDNNFIIQPFGAGEIVPGGGAVIDAVSAGTVEMCNACSYYAIGKDPTFTFGTVLPFGLNPRQMNAWLSAGDGNKMLNEFYAGFNLYGLPAGNSGVQMGGWFRKEIKSVDDLKGLKFRVGGLAGRILQKLGVVPQMLAGGDVYPALERGTIDAVEWSGPYDDEKLGFHKVAKYYYYPGWWDGGTVISAMFNLKHWNDLPSSYKAILAAAAAETNTWMQAKYDAENPAALRRLVAAGALLRPFSNEVMDASFNAATEVYAEIGASNAAFKKMLDSMISFRGDQYLWWQVAEYSFDSYLIRARQAQQRK